MKNYILGTLMVLIMKNPSAAAIIRKTSGEIKFGIKFNVAVILPAAVMGNP